jgi:hypothetical protein
MLINFHCDNSFYLMVTCSFILVDTKRLFKRQIMNIYIASMRITESTNKQTLYKENNTYVALQGSG